VGVRVVPAGVVPQQLGAGPVEQVQEQVCLAEAGVPARRSPSQTR